MRWKGLVFIKRVGIVTHYYKSNNYGGNLQAFALAHFINSLKGFKAEQICFSFIKGEEPLNNKKKKNISSHYSEKNSSFSHKCIFLFTHPFLSIRKLKRNSKKCFSRLKIKNRCSRFVNKLYFQRFEMRNNAILYFNQEIIPHSSVVYNENTICNSNTCYDIFITGSDQVWSGCSNAFMLGFVEDKKKISYAASIARKEITKHHSDYMKMKLHDYFAISVRDETDKNIVSQITDKNVEIVLDPVFLLNKEEWNKLATSRGEHEKDYVFCYFLGDCSKYKKIVSKFANKKRLKIISIPHFVDNENRVIRSDILFGDIKKYDVSPADFVSLIREAKYVFTDSFHAVVFSIIYHKEFFAFDRVSKYGIMNSRIINLLGQFDLLERYYCEENSKSISFFLESNEIEYDQCEEKLESEKNKSIRFLLNNL